MKCSGSNFVFQIPKIDVENEITNCAYIITSPLVLTGINEMDLLNINPSAP